jgi:hypothetical protein
MAEERNREIVKRRRAGATFPALAKAYGISTERVRQIFAQEVKKERRQQELAEADRRPDQPNLLHLEPWERAMLANFCGKAEFTPDDVEERGFYRGNFSCENIVWRRIVRWMARVGKKPATPPYRQTAEEWRENRARHSNKRA